MTKITMALEEVSSHLLMLKKEELLIQRNNDLKKENIDFKAIKTSGDINQNVKLSQIGGKNLFVKKLKRNFWKRNWYCCSLFKRYYP